MFFFSAGLNPQDPHLYRTLLPEFLFSLVVYYCSTYYEDVREGRWG